MLRNCNFRTLRDSVFTLSNSAEFPELLNRFNSKTTIRIEDTAAHFLVRTDTIKSRLYNVWEVTIHHFACLKFKIKPGFKFRPNLLKSKDVIEASPHGEDVDGGSEEYKRWSQFYRGTRHDRWPASSHPRYAPFPPLTAAIAERVITIADKYRWGPPLSIAAHLKATMHNQALQDNMSIVDPKTLDRPSIQRVIQLVDSLLATALPRCQAGGIY